MHDLSGRIALVTGAAGGLGAATSQVLTEAGATVIRTDIRGGRLDGGPAESGHGGSGAVLRLDVTDERETAEVMQGVVRSYGRLDILINNAGVDVTLPIDELTVDDWDRVLSVNLRGPFLLSRCVLPAMKARRSGHIVNIVSTAAKRAWPNATAYHASKWGLLGLSHALHAEARPYGVKVTAVVAGGMRTPFLLDRFPDIDPATLQDPKAVAETIRFLLTQPEESVIPEVTVLPMRETSWP
jgi:NAD(P)-dependent dehydrogenase (short-subunit alcohol dehydrogenase family)